MRSQKLREVLVDPLPRGSKLFALFDSCHSGTILDLAHYKCNKLLSGDVVRTRRKSLTGRFLLDFVSRPRTLPSSQQPLSSRFKCTGDCQKMRVEEQEAAHVVSLSACRSDEYVYDDNVAGATMTKFFIECVSQDPKPSLFTLLTHIKDRVDNLLNEYRRSQLRIVAHDLDEYMSCQKACCTSEARTDWQNPGYASHYPLDMDQVVDTIF